MLNMFSEKQVLTLTKFTNLVGIIKNRQNSYSLYYAMPQKKQLRSQ